MIWKVAPDYLKDIKERFVSIRTFYEITKLSENFPDEVKSFIATEEGELGRDDVAALKKKLTAPDTETNSAENSEPEVLNPAFENTAETSEDESIDDATTDDFSSDDSAEISNSAPTFQDEAFSGVDTSINESESESLADTDFDSETKSKKLKHPVFVGTVDGREAEIVMEMPTTDGMVKVKYEDDSLDEVLCENFILNRIYES